MRSTHRPMPNAGSSYQLKLFSGRANRSLAGAVAQNLGLSLGQMELYDFSDGENYCQIKENVRGGDVFVIQPTCQPVNEDCSNFLIRFDSAGDITDSDLDGHRGAQRGTGEIVDGILYFRMGVGTVHEFRGTLDGGGRSASGIMKNFDADGSQKSTPAIVARQ